MQITDVKVEVFGWQVEPWRVGAGMRFGGPRQIGVVTVETDEGVSGNAFLGVNPRELCALASHDALIRTRVGKARVSPSWLWRQNPRRTLRVCAVSFHRIEEETGFSGR